MILLNNSNESSDDVTEILSTLIETMVDESLAATPYEGQQLHGEELVTLMCACKLLVST